MLFSITVVTAQKEISNREDGINFEKNISLTAALAKAKKENKLVFIDCYTSWCGPCKELAQNIFPLKEVGDFYNKNFICLAFDFEKNPDGIKLSKKYNIKAYPTFLFLNEKGEIQHIKVWPGSTKEEIISAGNEAFDVKNNYKSIVSRINEGDKSIKLLKPYLKSRTNLFNRDSLINSFFNSFSTQEIYSEKYWVIFYNYIDDIKSPQFVHFINNRETYEEHFGKKKVKRKILRTLEINFHKYKNNQNEISSLISIDPVLFNQIECWFEYMGSLRDFNSHNESFDKWKTFVSNAKVFFSIEKSFPEDLNRFSWTVYENFKKFDDYETLNYAYQLSKLSVQISPNEHYILDTYAHINFALGKVNEAIKFEEKAIQLAIQSKSKSVDNYKKELNKFKK